MANTPPKDFIADLAQVALPVIQARDADIVFYSGGIADPADDVVISLAHRKRRPNLLLMLTTVGGSPDTAYRIARPLRKAYEKGTFSIFIDTVCKSAGTLIALAADELIMSDRAHLGPIDIQVRNQEEAGEMSSGLTPSQALTTLKQEAWSLFQFQFSKMRYSQGFNFSTRIAAETATQLTVGLLRTVYEQIDPMRLGEIDRAMRIAADYGERLSSKNLKPDCLARLLTGYPSHTFVIDRHEATSLFTKVVEPTQADSALAAELHALAMAGQRGDEVGRAPQIYSISELVEPKEEAAKMSDEDENEAGTSKTDRGDQEGNGAEVGTSSGNGESAAAPSRGDSTAIKA